MSEDKQILRAVTQPERGEPSSHADFVFWCPACRCGHGVWTTKRNSLQAIWEFDGNMEKPTFKPSLKIEHPTWDPPVTPENLEEWKRAPWTQTKKVSICHVVVTGGVLNFCSDCTHSLAGKSIPMEPF